MPTSTKTQTRRPRFGSVAGTFKQWLGVRDQKDQLTAEQDELRLKLLDRVLKSGHKDDNGHYWIDLDEPIEFTDFKGKTKIFSRLKNQLSLVPARPQPDPDLAEALLKKKGLWITPEQEKLIRRLRSTLSLFDITVELNPDRFSDLVFTKEISDKEYESTLQEQTEKVSFIPVEE